MNKYEVMLDDIAGKVAKQENKTPDEIAEVHEKEAGAGMLREATCQILATRKPVEREHYFKKYPELRTYYPHRIRKVT